MYQYYTFSGLHEFRTQLIFNRIYAMLAITDIVSNWNRYTGEASNGYSRLKSPKRIDCR